MKKLILLLVLLVFPFWAEAEYHCDKPVGKLAFMVAPSISVTINRTTNHSSLEIPFPTQWIESYIIDSGCFILSELKEADFILEVVPTVSYTELRSLVMVLARSLYINTTVDLYRLRGRSRVGHGSGGSLVAIDETPSVEVYAEEVRNMLSDTLNKLFYKSLPFL